MRPGSLREEAALGPPLPDGSIAPWRQTRLGWFLLSAYGGLSRLAAMQGAVAAGAGGVVLQAASVQAAGIAAAVLRGTAWQPDFWAAPRLPGWEFCWLPAMEVAPQVPPAQALLLDAAALGLAIASVVRPLPLLPAGADAAQPFALALATAELEGGRLLQPFLRMLQGMVPALPREVVEAAAERRQAVVANLWQEVVDSLVAP